jgi:protein-S-isoprenylcysteine O-methyltransferase Ste14
MILGVLTTLLGEAVMFSSAHILKWAGLFFLINTTYFKLSEEPGLESRFGDEYIQYKKKVGMWIPRFRPYAETEENKPKP